MHVAAGIGHDGPHGPVLEAPVGHDVPIATGVFHAANERFARIL